METRVVETVPVPTAPAADTGRQRAVRALALVLAGVSAGLVAALVAAQIHRERRTEEDARASARAQAVTASAAIDRELGRAVRIAASLADDLSAGRLKAADLPARITATLATHPGIFEVGVAFAPYAFDPLVRLYAPHAARTDGVPRTFGLEARYDYTTYDWYKDGLAAPGWGEPYFGTATGTLVVGYAAPFFRPGDPSKTPIGVARINLSLDGIRNLVSRTSIGPSGYGFLVSRKMVFLSYPDERYVLERRTVQDTARQVKDPARVALMERALRGETIESTTVSSRNGQTIWLVNQPVPSAGRVLGIAFFKQEVSLDARDRRRGYIKILCGSMLFLFAASLLFLRIERAGHGRLWSAAIAIGILLSAGIGGLWWLTLVFPDRNDEASVHILDGIGLQRFLAARTQSAPAGSQGAPIQVATGVLVRTARFAGANDAVITGRVWQRIPASRRAEVAPGIEMPDAETFSLRDAQTSQQGDTEVTSWAFSATLRQPSDWSIKYPFDRALTRIRMLPKPAPVPVILAPDLQAYEFLTPSSLPGIEKTLILPGWRLDHSYFSYVAQNSGATMAAPTGQDRRFPYDLAFNLVSQRRFLDPFVSSVLPIIVIVCLLFSLLMIGSKENAKVAATGFKASDVLRAGATLLFPALIAQVNLRSKMDASQIIYIEYFYFVLYLAILGVAANALAFTLRPGGMIQVRDNLIPKLLFWPAVLGACFLVSLVFLY